MPPRRKTLEELYFSRVQRTAGCWGWTGSIMQFGYGKIVPYKGASSISAHRASWMIYYGKIPEGMCVLHTCDNPICTNPEHLFLGTQMDNMRDAQRKGRLSVPEKGWKRTTTHCPQGHKYSEENTYRWHSLRICRKCHAAHERKRRENRRQSA